ncbi:MAG TPA: hypothetical protein VGF84_20940 [Micromonosporaceae bacterium]
MSEFDLDELLAGAVDDYRTETLGRITPAGTSAAHATATHRKRVHAIAMSVLVAALVVAPVSAYAAIDHDHNGPPSTAASTKSSPPPTPTSSPSTTSSTRATRHTAITATDLADAVLQVPTWGAFNSMCPHGTVRMVKGMFSTGRDSSDTPSSYGLATVVTTDVDHDGTGDAVALLSCHRSDPGIEQVVAFHRGGNGSIQTLGQVLLAVDGTVVGAVHAIDGLTANASGTVRVQVSDLSGSSGGGVSGQVVQWRTYGWTGHRFTQTAGSTRFSTSAYQLTAHLGNMVFTGSGGNRTGTMTVTIHNGGSRAVSNVSIRYASDESGALRLTGSACTAPTSYAASTCPVGTIAAGRTGTVTLHLTIRESDVASFTHNPSLAAADVVTQIRVGDQKLASQPALGKVVFN